MSKNERQGKAKPNRTKRLRQLFIASTIMYCINEQMSMPLHTLIADMVDSQGGSDRLMRYLNNLGVCASSDSLARYVQYRVQLSNQKGNDSQSPDSFKIISVDNIDVQHPYAKVCHGTQTSSWHGTSIQQVQPNPSLSTVDCIDPDDFASLSESPAPQPESLIRAPVHTEGEVTTNEHTHLNRTVNTVAEPTVYSQVISRKRSYARSPHSSPSKLYSPKRKIQRRSRTGKENSNSEPNLFKRERNLFTHRCVHSGTKEFKNKLELKKIFVLPVVSWRRYPTLLSNCIFTSLQRVLSLAKQLTFT